MHAPVLIMSPFHHNPTANGSRFFSEAAVSDRRVALLFFQNISIEKILSAGPVDWHGRGRAL